MIDEKICPFMSRCSVDSHGDHIIATAYCQREQCMAWGDIVIEHICDIETIQGCRLIP